MKKNNKIFILMLLSTSLIGCGGVSNSSILSNNTSNNSTNSISNDSSNSSVTEKTEIEKFHDLSNLLKNANSFSVSYSYLNDNYSDIYNFSKKYTYSDFSKGGYITLPFNEEERLYAYTLENDLTLGARPTLSDGSFASFESCTYNIKSIFAKLSEMEFNNENSVVLEEIEDIAKVAGLLGFYNYAIDYYFYSVQFFLNDANQMVAKLILDSDFAGAIDESYLVATFDLINNSSNEKVENYIASYVEPSVKLDADKYSLITSSVYTISGKLFENNSELEVLSVSNSVNINAIESSLNSLTSSVSTYVTKGEDGYAYINSISALTGDISSEKGMPWSEIVTLSEIINESDFLSYGDNIYHYFGNNINDVLETLFGYDLVENLGIPVRDFTLTFNNDSVDVNIYFMDAYTEDNQKYSFALNAIFSNASDIDGFPKVDSESASEFKSKYLDGKLDGSQSVRMTIQEPGQYPMYTSIITYNPGVILYSVSDNSTSPIQTEYYGKYQISDTMIQDFTLVANGANFIATANGTAYEGVLSEEVNLFGIAPEAISKKSDTLYTLVDAVVDQDKVLPTTSRSNGNKASSVGFEITTDDTHVLEIKYTSTGFLQSTETIKYEYENVNISSSILDALKALAPVSGVQTWKDSASNVYEELVATFGEEFADCIPYLYNQSLDKDWVGSANWGPFNICAFNWDVDWASYSSQYGELLLQNGYVLFENTADDEYKDGTTYFNETDGVIIVITADIMDGMYIYQVK